MLPVSTLRVLIVGLDFFILYRQGITFVFDILMLLKSSMTSSFSRKYAGNTCMFSAVLYFVVVCMVTDCLLAELIKDSILDNTTGNVDYLSPIVGQGQINRLQRGYKYDI